MERVIASDLYDFIYDTCIFGRCKEISDITCIIRKSQYFLWRSMCRLETIFIFFGVCVLIDVYDNEWFRVFKLFRVSVSEKKCVIMIVENIGGYSFILCFYKVFESSTTY